MATVREITPGVWRVECKKTIRDPVEGKVQRRWSLTVHTRGGRRGEEEAQRVALDAQADVDKGIDPRLRHWEGLRVQPDGMTVAGWAPAWLAAQDYEESWRVKVQRILDHDILPVFGKDDVDAVSRIAVKGWLTGLSARRRPRTGARLSSKTVANIWGVFARMMADATAEGLRDVNPCAGIKPPKPSAARRGVRQLTPAEVHMLAETMLIRYDGRAAGPVQRRWRLLTLTLAWTGCRWSELGGLRRRPEELHLTAQPPYITVYEPIKTTGRRGGRYHGDPKSAAGGRDIQLIRPLADEIAAFVAHKLPYAFGTTTGGAHHYQDYQQAFARAAEHLGRPELEIHDLRRFHATLLRHCPRVAVQERLGHQPADVTDVYTHATDADRAEILRVLAAAWDEGRVVG